MVNKNIRPTKIATLNLGRRSVEVVVMMKKYR